MIDYTALKIIGSRADPFWRSVDAQVVLVQILPPADREVDEQTRLQMAYNRRKILPRKYLRDMYIRWCKYLYKQEKGVYDEAESPPACMENRR